MDYQRLQSLSSAPGSPVAGQVYYDSTKNALGIYNGSEWVYGSSTAWGPSGGTTEIDGNMTLGGKAVSAVPPTTGSPIYLVYNGTEWIATTESGGGAVDTVTAADTSIVVTGTTDNPELATNTLDVIATDHPPAAAWSNNSKKITSLANGSSAQDAAAFGQIPTTIDGVLTLGGKPVSATPPTVGSTIVLVYNGTDWIAESITIPTTVDGELTLGGKAVSAVPPTTGSPIGLIYNGTEWIAEVVPGAYTEIDGNLTLGGKSVAATPPTSGGPYALAYNGTDWVPEAFMEAAQSAGASGRLLASDGSGDPYWADTTNDALQLGFVGLTNPGVISAAISASPDVTFTNWPTGDLVWLSAPPMRFTCPAPGTQILTGVTSGDWAYVYAILTAPGTPGGTPTVSLHVGTSRSTAALAAADQVSNTAGTIVWDGVVKNTSGTYTLTGGTPASGSVIPSAGRDRRLWARGVQFLNLYTSGNIAVASGGSYGSLGFTFRAECSGVLMEVGLQATINIAESYAGAVGLFVDGVQVDTFTIGIAGGTGIAGAAANFAVDPFWYIPSAGSHLFDIRMSQNGLSSAYCAVLGGSADPIKFIIREQVAQNANNGTT